MTGLPLGLVLVVDDSTADNFLAKRALTTTGLASRVVTYLSAEEALAYLADPAHEAVDLILLDVNMPRMDGFDFAAEYRQLNDAQKACHLFLMISSDLSMTDERRLKNEPAIDATVAKPLDIEAIARLVGLKTESRM